MAYSTRSRSDRSLVDSADLPITGAEFDALQDRMLQKGKQIEEQSELLNSQRLAFEKEKEAFRLEREREREIAESQPLNSQTIRDIIRQELRVQTNASNEPDTRQSINLIDHATIPVRERRNSEQYGELSPLRLKDVADSIPKYDGQRMSVFQFSQACERALKIIPAHEEPHLVQLIMGRLQGHAYTIMQDSDFRTVSPLLRKLKKIFGPNKSLNQYKGELGNAYMRTSESIFEYIARIKEIQTAIVDCESAERGRVDSWTMNSIETEVLDSFVNGLPSELLIRLKIDGYNNLDDAFARAVQLSRTLETEVLRKKPSFAPPFTRLPRRDVPPPQPVIYQTSQQRLLMQRPGAPFIKPLIPGQAGPNTPGQVICHFCKAPGHMIADCRKRLYRNSQLAQQANQNRDANAPNQSGNDASVPNTSSVQRDTTQKGRQIAAAQAEQIKETNNPSEPQSSTQQR